MTNPERKPEPGLPVLALDLGEKTVGAATCDAMSITIKSLPPLPRSSWKKLLLDVKALVERFDAQTLVIGLPLRLDGTKGSAAETVERLALNFARSLPVPVYLQDERLTSKEASSHLRQKGYDEREISALIDSESAAIILRDFLHAGEERFLVRPDGGGLS
jgi:putative holliday junction resolvase